MQVVAARATLAEQENGPTMSTALKVVGAASKFKKLLGRGVRAGSEVASAATSPISGGGEKVPLKERSMSAPAPRLARSRSMRYVPRWK